MWYYYFEYTVYVIYILYNYNNFRYFITIKSLSTRQAQYAEELARFNFKIKYKFSKLNPTNILFQCLDYAKGFKNSSKRTILNAILPILQQKLRVIGLMGGPNTTTLIPQVVYLQYISDPYKPSTSEPEYSVILNNTLINLMVLDPKKDPLAQVMVPYNNLVSHLYIIYYLASTNFAQSLVLQQEVVVATLAEMAFKE